MEKIIDGWFHERSEEMWPGEAMSLQVEQVLHHERSKFQDLLVFKSRSHGVVLVLDGVIQVTERDEFAYQEMMAHLPLCSHPNPKNVLVVGGGDGGVVREILKHESVAKVTLCEIDEKVIEASKKYLPFMASALDDSRVHVHVGDGLAFMKENENSFDIIITDSSDPVGPAQTLFEQPYYASMRNALRSNGILCTQGESIWLHLDLIKNMYKFCRNIFPVVGYAYTTIPTYPSGQIGFILCSKNPLTDFEHPINIFSSAQLDEYKIRYYNQAIHTASFALPQFAAKALKQADSEIDASIRGARGGLSEGKEEEIDDEK